MLAIPEDGLVEVLAFDAVVLEDDFTELEELEGLEVLDELDAVDALEEPAEAAVGWKKLLPAPKPTFAA